MDFGEEEQAEQLVQILQSSRIRDKVIHQFGLMEHYDIDSTDDNKYFKLMKEYEGHISFTRTRYGSISIDVLDEKPELAAEIANKIVGIMKKNKSDIEYVTDRLGHDRRYAIDARKIERELGWKPKETFESGIEKTVQWYLDHPEWVQGVTSGEYRKWIGKQYG